ncbi:hypothetical protein RF11_00749 [Thelohanellus kitauei]|uniref:Peptidase A2 domain-containing protein n=1 Tax=Thelohanellus kitauei TaxID=669202 RepID=A0A0C2IZ99_THEKT|nr:hypothetical protein RF11_00749 [Thelohanellus kitauei]
MRKSLVETLDDIPRRLDILEIGGKKVKTSEQNIDERCQNCGRSTHLTENVEHTYVATILKRKAIRRGCAGAQVETIMPKDGIQETIQMILENGTVLNDLIDTGASVSLIPSNFVSSKPLSKSYYRLVSVFQTQTTPIGSTLDSQTNIHVTAMLSQNSHTFAKSKFDTNVAKDIDFPVYFVKDEPIKKTPYGIHINVIDEVKTQIDQMLQMSIIRPSNSPWLAPSLFFSILDMETDIGRFQSKEWISIKHDFSLGQALNTTNLTFGLLFRHISLQNVLRIVRGISTISLYTEKWLWRIFYISENFSKHLKYLVLNSNNLNASWLKVKIKFLGSLDSGSGICTYPSHVEAFLNCICPRKDDEHRRYLGTCNFIQEIDLTGSLLVSKHNNKYILVMVDHFSKWVEAVALPDQTAESASMAAYSNIFSRFVILKRIHSYVLVGVRVAMQPSTGHSPSMLIYGREIKTQSEMIFEKDFEEPYRNYHIYVDKLFD